MSDRRSQPLPDLPPKQRAFVEGLARGLDKDEAYQAAGYVANQMNSHRMWRAPLIQAHLALLSGSSLEQAWKRYEEYGGGKKGKAGKAGKAGKGKSGLDEFIGDVPICEITPEVLIRLQVKALSMAFRDGSVGQANASIKQLATLTGHWEEKTATRSEVTVIDATPEQTAQALMRVLEDAMIDVTPSSKKGG